MNAKEEFLYHVKNKPIVKCARITLGDEDCDYEKKGVKKFILKVDYSKEDYDNFLNTLSFIYDDGYGGQELYGYIWYVDDTWSDRGEYDGSEWWQYQSIPEIPSEVK